MLSFLALEGGEDPIDLALPLVLGERYEQIRATEIAVVFGNLVLKDEVVALPER